MDHTASIARDVQVTAIGTPANVEFRANRSRWEALIDVALGGCATYAFAVEGGTGGIVIGTGMCVLFGLSAIGKATSEPDRSVHLAFDSEGLLAPHILARKVPWAVIQGYSVDNDPERETLLFVNVIDPDQYEPKQTDPLQTWPVISTGFRVRIGRLGCGYDDIEAAFRRFAPGIPKI